MSKENGYVLGVVLRVHVLLSRPLGTFSICWKFLCHPPVLLCSDQETINVVFLRHVQPQACTQSLSSSPACAFRSRSAWLRLHKQTGSSVPRLLLLLGQGDPCAPSPGMCSSTPAHSAGRDARGNSSPAAPRLLWGKLTLVIIDAKLILYRSQFVIAADFRYTVKTDVHLERCPASAVSPMRAGRRWPGVCQRSAGATVGCGPLLFISEILQVLVLPSVSGNIPPPTVPLVRAAKCCLSNSCLKESVNR